MPTILLNKPYEVLTQFTDEAGRATLKDYVPVPGVYPVGRLDYDSEGLLLLTDDKHLQHRLSDPRFKVPKTYHAQVEGTVGEAALARLQAGVQLKEGFTLPALAAALPGLDAAGPWPRTPPIRYRAAIPTGWLALTITQGMNRQVRKMCAAVGLPCLRLVRMALGPLTLAGLAPGEWRELTADELLLLRNLGNDGNARPGGAGSRPGSKGSGAGSMGPGAGNRPARAGGRSFVPGRPAAKRRPGKQ